MTHVVAIVALVLGCVGFGLLFRDKRCAGCGGCESDCREP